VAAATGLTVGLSAAALAVSSAAALWQYARWRLEGGRVWVRLVPGLVDEYSIGRGVSWSDLATPYKTGWHLEAAVIEVENPSRTAVSISNVSLDFGRGRRKTYTVTPTPLKAPEASVGPVVRLEPFDRAVFVYDVWQPLQATTTRSYDVPRPTTVRASVRVAGRRRRARSSWFGRWAVRPNQVSFICSSLEIGMATYQAVTRHVRQWGDSGQIAAIPTALEVRELFPTDGAPPTREQLAEILTRHNHLDAPGMDLVAFYMAPDLARHYGRSNGAGHRRSRSRPGVGENPAGESDCEK
jgi:hypothetical protein